MDSIEPEFCTSADEIRNKVKELLKEWEEEEFPHGPGLRCPKCGSQLVHYRLCGYQCVRGCR